MTNPSTKPSARQTRNGRHKQVRWFSLLLGVAVIVVSGAVVADVVLTFAASGSFGTNNEFTWAPGGNAVTATADGFLTNTFNTPNTYVSFVVNGEAGDFGSYVVNALEFTAAATPAGAETWTVGFSVTTALAETGVNAAYGFMCSVAPSAPSFTGSPVAQGVDSAGAPWAIYAPTCTGTAADVSLAATGPAGGSIPVTTSTSASTVVVYFSWAVAIDSAGISGTPTPAVLTAIATST